MAGRRLPTPDEVVPRHMAVVAARVPAMRRMISRIGISTIPFVSDRGEGRCKRQTYPTVLPVGGVHSSDSGPSHHPSTEAMDKMSDAGQLVRSQTPEEMPLPLNVKSFTCSTASRALYLHVSP